MMYQKQTPNIDIKLSHSELQSGKLLLKNINKGNKKTICLFTYATGNKCYSEAWWSELYKELLESLPCYNFVEILPIENISNLSRRAPTFYSTDIRELASFIANTDIVVAADSGIMHLASSTLTPTIGLFSVTDTKVYAPYNKNSMAIDTNTNSIDDIVLIIKKVLVNIELAP